MSKKKIFKTESSKNLIHKELKSKSFPSNKDT